MIFEVLISGVQSFAPSFAIADELAAWRRGRRRGGAPTRGCGTPGPRHAAPGPARGARGEGRAGQASFLNTTQLFSLRNVCTQISYKMLI